MGDGFRPKRSMGAAARGAAAMAAFIALAGCAAHLVYRNPTTSELVDCTAAAEREVVAHAEMGQVVLPPSDTGLPRRQELSSEILTFDYERQCAEQLKRAGWLCVSGCR